MSATLVIANSGRKGKRKFVLRHVAKPRAAKRANPRRAAKKPMRKNAWSEKRTHPVLKAPKHRAAAYKGRGYSPKKAAAKARTNPNEYRAAFTRLKADMAKATRKASAAAKAARTAASRTNPADAKSVAQRLADLRRRYAKKNPTVVGAPARKEKAMSKKPRSAAQKAATKRMLAAAAAKRGGKSSPKKAGKKRKSGGRKKARTAAQKRATAKLVAHNKKGGHKAPKRHGKKRHAAKKHSKRRAKKSHLQLRLGSVKRALARSKGKKGKGPMRHRRVLRARRAGLIARTHGVGAATLRKYGLTRVNPSPKGVLKDIWALAPELGVAAAAFVGVAWGTMKLIAALPASVTDLWKGKDDAETAQRAAYLPVLSGMVLAIGGYFGLRMYPKLAKYAAPVAFGGVAAVALKALTGITVENTGDDKATNPRISLGKSLGLPIGEYVSVAGYVDVGGGRMLSVNGIGEYVSVAGIHRMALPGGESMRYEGSLNGMGEYVMDPVGLSGGIFPSSSSLGELVDHTQSQVPLRRDPMWGLRGDPEGNVNIQKLLGGGSVSGGIFDRSR